MADYNQLLLGIYGKRQGEPTGPAATSIRRPQEFGPPAFEPAQGVDADTDDFITNWRNTAYEQQRGGAQVQGPGGEDLPQGAQMWDYYGRPFYGEGLQGWWQGFKSRLSAPFNESEFESAFRDVQLPQLGGQTVKGFDPARWWENLKSGSAGGAVGTTARVVQETVGAGIQALDEPAKKAEQALAVAGSAAKSNIAAGLQARGGAGSYLQYVPKEVREQQAAQWQDYFKTHPDTLKGWFEDSFERGGIAKFGALDTAWQAGRILYSSAGAGTLQAEYERRYKAGENPALLAQELERPGRELAGRLVFDPLNIIGGGAREATTSRSIRSVQDEFYKIPGGLGDVLRLDALNDNDVVVNLVEAAALQQRNSRRAAQGLAELTEARGLANLTADGKRFVVGRRTGELSGWIARNAASPDEAGETLRALALMASDNADEVASGIATAKNFADPAPLFSQTGNELGVILRRIIGETEKTETFFDTTRTVKQLNGGGFLSDLAKAQEQGIDEVIGLINRRMESAVQDMIPSVQDMANAAKQVKRGSDVERDIELAKQYAALGWRARVANDVAQKMNVVYKPVNSFFAAVYMGYSPGYAFRNFITNSLHVAVDQGPSALFVNPVKAIENVQGWLGGAIPKGVAGFGRGVQGAEQVADFGKGTQVFRRVSEKFEEWGAAQVVHASVKRTMGRMLQPGKALPELRPLIDSGLSESAAKQLSRLVVEYKGDVDKAARAFIDAAKTGTVDVFRSMEWIPEADRKILDNFDKYDELTDGLRRATNRDEALAVLSKIKEDIRDGIRQAGGELGGVDEASEMAPEAMQATEELGDQIGRMVNNYYQANDNAAKLLNNAMLDVLNGKAAEAARANDANLSNAVATMQAAYTRTQTERDKLFSQHKAFADRLNDWWRAVKARKGRGDEMNYAQLWRDIGAEGDAPTSWVELQRRFWVEHYYPKSNDYFRQGRELLNSSLEAVSKVLDAKGNSIDEARKANNLARLYDDLVRNYQQAVFAVDDAVARGDSVGALANLAWQYNVRVTDDNGRTLFPKLLNTVNKWLPEGVEKFTRVEDVPLDLARGAFARRLEDASAKILAGTDEAADLQSVYQAGRVIGAEIDRMAKAPVESIASIGNALTLEAHNLLAQLEYAESGFLRFDDVTGKFVEAVEGNLPAWYQDFKWGVDNVKDVLNKIIAGRGLDSGKRVEQMKAYLLTRMTDTVNGDPRVLLRFGYEREAYDVLARQLDEGVDFEQLYGSQLQRMYDVLAKDPETLRSPGPFVLTHGDDIVTAPTPASLERVPSPAQAVAANSDGLLRTLDRMTKGVQENWGRTEDVVFSRKVNNAIGTWAKGAKQGVAQARLVAANVANAARDFTLLSYPEKRNFDLALAYIYPYQFWYNRTYKNWLARVARNPDTLAAYAKYKEYMEQIHAGAPTWWKYNINSDELLGIETENPLFFNLEATLNPLNGLTGVDFNDPLKRKNWWTNTLDDLNKFGPSTWTPYSMATALALYIQGEDDAASRWGGRLIPQTATLKSALSVANVNVPTREGVNEFDPMVQFFSNGMDSYERRRVGRALGWMVEQGQVTQEQALDASRTQQGDVWRQAVERAIRARAGGQLSSFFLGVGFKGRSRSDIEIDQADQSWRKIWGMADTLSPEELRNSLEAHRQQYPFHEAVVLSRKGGIERDRSYAYSVLSRIPPGQKNELAELVGITGDMFDLFYQNKGDLSVWADTDRQRFMAGIVDLGAILSLPDTATSAEWNSAKSAYAELDGLGKQQFGDDIWDKVDLYYAYKKDAGQERADQYIEANPDVADALSWKDSQIINDPLLSQYYGAIYRVERYYRNLMYDAIKTELGKDIFDKWDEYNVAKLTGQGKQYWKAHPELEKYLELKDTYGDFIAEATARVAQSLKEPNFPDIRQDADLSSLGQQAIAEQMGNVERTPYDFTWDDWQAELSPPLRNLVLDFVLRGEDLPRAAEDQLEYIADGMNLDYPLMLQLIENSVAGF